MRAHHSISGNAGVQRTHITPSYVTSQRVRCNNATNGTTESRALASPPSLRRVSRVSHARLTCTHNLDVHAHAQSCQARSTYRAMLCVCVSGRARARGTQLITVHECLRAWLRASVCSTGTTCGSALLDFRSIAHARTANTGTLQFQ